jgi:hypothetical protein
LSHKSRAKYEQEREIISCAGYGSAIRRLRWWWRRQCWRRIRLWFVDVDDYHVILFINVWLYRLGHHGLRHYEFEYHGLEYYRLRHYGHGPDHFA